MVKTEPKTAQSPNTVVFVYNHLLVNLFQDVTVVIVIIVYNLA